uniref:Uncharacterized protein n=1 Tax=Setaria viridis TaxID=4556 RepID=A0A4U6WG25_SETVI|nr:hypothetical protein SEVIR_1G263000v2 [Setaria viridis]
MPTVEEVLAMEPKVLPSKESIDEANGYLCCTAF